MKNKRILVVSRMLTHYRASLFQSIEARGEYSIDVATTACEVDYKKVNIFNSKLINCNMFGKKYTINYSSKLVSYVKQRSNEYDYIVLEGATNILNNLFICKYFKQNHVNYIVWDAGRRNSKMTPVRKIAQKPLEYVWKSANAIIAYSSIAKKYFSDIGIQYDKIFVCQNTLNVDKFDREIKEIHPNEICNIRNRYAMTGEKIVLYVGAIEKRKRVHDLIEAFKRMKEKFNNAVLIIIGSGDQLDELRDLTKKDKDIFFTGRIVDGVLKYFLAADLFVLPSEGGLSINQAMISSLPVIASSADGTELDLIVDGENGFLFSEGDIDELSRKMYMVLSDDDKIAEMGVVSRRIIDERVNVNTFYRSLVTCLRYVDSH